MDSSRFDQLTEPQRDCLRRVARLQSSKEMARDLGVSRHAIDQRIERAIRTLAADDRFAAARMLAAYEDIASERFTRDPQSIASTASTSTMDVPAEEPADASGNSDGLHDGGALLDAYLPPIGGQRILERGRSMHNVQSTRQRLIAVIMLSVALILAIALLLAVMIAFGTFLDETAP